MIEMNATVRNAVRVFRTYVERKNPIELVVTHVSNTAVRIWSIVTDVTPAVKYGRITNRMTRGGAANAISEMATENMYVSGDTGEATTTD